ncbi:MAG: hypothetical protein KAS32_04645 [Candidatus Peribacteraceae bacterium]|nr:hypothetical protein [Candidatus Peribacteraceae bacterium]
MPKNNNNINMNQVVANTMVRMYAEASNGVAVRPSKIHALWVVGAGLDNDLTPSKPKTPANLVLKLMVLLVLTYVTLDRMVLASGKHREPSHSRTSRWADEETKRIQRDRVAVDTDGFEDLSVIRTDFEQFSSSNCTNFEAGQLVADCHGFKTVDDTNLDKMEAQAEKVHTMADIDDMLGDGMTLNNTGRLCHKGLDFVDAIRDEVGPWTYTFETDEGVEVVLGYEGTVSTMEDMPERWTIEEESYLDDCDAKERIENGYLADERRERGDRFANEFDRALHCSSKRLVNEYRAAWTRYRARQLAIGRALVHAPRGHGLWGHGWLTKQQWMVIETTYAARAKRTTPDKWGRPHIAKERLRKEEVIKWAGLAYSLL